MIQGVEGLMGNGKSYWAVTQLLKAKKEGRRAMANFHSRTGAWDFALWEDMKDAHNAFIVIDEAQMWFGSRAWQGTKQAELSVFQQGRKEGIDLLWVVQHHDRIDVAVREVTAYIWRAKKIGKGWFMLRKYQESEPKVTLERKFIKYRPSVAQHYFTEEVIGDRNGDGYRFGRSSAYGAAGAEVVRSGTTLVLVPNYFRIELPHGGVYVDGTNDARVRREVWLAVQGWRSLGQQKDPESLVTPYYRDASGRLTALDKTGLIIDGQAAPGALELILQEFRYGFGLTKQVPQSIGIEKPADVLRLGRKL